MKILKKIKEIKESLFGKSFATLHKELEVIEKQTREMRERQRERDIKLYRDEVYPKYFFKRFIYLGQPAIVTTTINPEEYVRVTIHISHADNNGKIRESRSEWPVESAIEYLEKITNED